MRKPDFTIAVAAYNVESYLEECIESIIGQLDDSMELLLVDDGSVDGSGVICDRYAQKDNRITVIHQQNGGLSAARNTAIECALGKWIVFVDGDDRLAKNAMAVMREYVEEVAQLVIFDYIEFDQNGRQNCCLLHDDFVIDTPKLLGEFRTSTLYRHPALSDVFTLAQCITSWGKMWRLSYIREHNLRFDMAVKRSEDNAFAFAAFRHMDRIYVVRKSVYEYRKNRSGIMQRFEPQTPEHFRILTSIIEKDMAAHEEMNNPLLMEGFCGLCFEGFRCSIWQAIGHKECHWNRKERIAYLRELAQADWVKMAEQHSNTSVLLHWMKKGAYRKMDLCCRGLRWLALVREFLKPRTT